MESKQLLGNYTKCKFIAKTRPSKLCGFCSYHFESGDSGVSGDYG